MDFGKMTPDEFVDAVVDMAEERPTATHPFLDTLEQGKISREQLAKCAYQTMYLFNQINRAVGAAYKHNMSQDERATILENMIDEETGDRCGDQSHYAFALKFGEACGYDPVEVEEAAQSGTYRVHPQLEESIADIIYSYRHMDSSLGMASGMVGSELLFSPTCTRLVNALKKHYGMSDEDVQVFHIHIEGDYYHGEQGKQLVRDHVKTPEDRAKFFSQTEAMRNRNWEMWDAVWKSAYLDLPQGVQPMLPAQKPKKESRMTANFRDV